MATDFQKRLDVAKEFEDELLAYLQGHPTVATAIVNGTEHTHPEFVELLRNNDREASRFIRFAPDGVMLLTAGDVIHYDAKAAKTIEKDAYGTYMDYVRCGCRVLLFVKYDNTVYCQDVDKLRLIDGNDTVAPFKPERRFPVDDDGWICPRQSSGYSRRNYGSNMSGTPYREIDFTSMKTVDTT